MSDSLVAVIHPLFGELVSIPYVNEEKSGLLRISPVLDIFNYTLFDLEQLASPTSFLKIFQNILFDVYDPSSFVWPLNRACLWDPECGKEENRQFTADTVLW